MPLIQLGNGYGGYGEADNGEPACRHTVVYSDNDRSVGIIVGKIVDIVHDDVEKTDDGLPSRCVIQDRVTEVVNLGELVASTAPEFFRN